MKQKRYTSQEVEAEIERQILAAGSVRQWSIMTGVPQTTINHSRRADLPFPKVAAAAGFVRLPVEWVRKDEVSE